MLPSRSTLWGSAFLLIAVVLVISAVERTFFKRGANPQVVQETQRRADLEATQVAGIRAEQLEAEKLLGEASVQINDALKQIEVWDKDIVPLRDNAAGQTIAEQEDLSNQMAALFEERRPAAEELKAAQQRLGELREKVKRLAAESTPTRVPLVDMAEIGKLHNQALLANQRWGMAVKAAQAIEREARRKRTDTPREQIPLRERMVEQSDKNTLAELAAERERERDVLQKQDELEKAREQLKKEATSAEVQRVLAPFLARRLVQPKLSGASVMMERVLQEQPMSLSRLESMGALAESVDGLKILARVGTSRKLPDPRWTFGSEPGNWTPDTQKLLQQAQGMLRQYGTALVEAGLLSP